MSLLTFAQTAEWFRGKSVAVVGSGPGCLENSGRQIDSHDVVVRINNYKIKGFEDLVGRRTDVFYTFGGTSIRKPPEVLIEDGVTLMMFKCPDDTIAHLVDPWWHKKNGKMIGLDYRYIYELWRPRLFCPAYIPTTGKFMEYFRILGNHQPTTGFACLLDLLSFDLKSLYVTGFDFFHSEIHNVDEKWPGREKNPDDPYRHVPDSELEYLRDCPKKFPVVFDSTITKLFLLEQLAAAGD